jgi:hypothetical protein
MEQFVAKSLLINSEFQLGRDGGCKKADRLPAFILNAATLSLIFERDDIEKLFSRSLYSLVRESGHSD